MSNLFTLASNLGAPLVTTSSVISPLLPRRLSAGCIFGDDMRGDVVAKKFPYRFPNVLVFRRGKATARAGWYISYECPIENRRIQRAVSPDVEQTAAEARRISTLIGQAASDPGQLRQIITENRERKPLLGFWKKTPAGNQYIPGHLDDYRIWLKGRNREPKYVQETFRAARKMIRLCRFKTIHDVEGAILENRVAEFMRERRDLSLRQCNRYLKVPRQFLGWMARPKVGRSRTNPLADVELYNDQTDRRRQRRALSRDDLIHLIGVVRASDPILGMSGPDRAMLYLLKFYTGFRNGETRTLVRESFRLVGAQPYIIVEASFSKNRRRDEQPIDPEFAAELARWLVNKPMSVPVFVLPDKPNRMFRRDLEAAGISYNTHDGIVDLYALRHTYGTLLGQSGASIKTVQELMRHGDIRMTQRYMHSTRHDQNAALKSLPNLMPKAQQDTSSSEDINDGPSVSKVG